MSIVSQAQIYEAVFDDEAMGGVLSTIAAGLGARSFCSSWLYADGGKAWLRDSGHWTVDQIDLYTREYAMDDVWSAAQLGQWRPGRATDVGALVTKREFERSRLHDEFLRPIGDDMEHCLSVASDNRSGLGAVSFHRGRSPSGFDPREVAALDEMADHLARMVAMRGRFAALERRSERRGALIDMLDLPVMMVTASLMLVESNAAADALIQAGPFALANGRLRLQRPASHDALEAAVRRALDPVAPAAGAIGILQRDGPSLPFSIVAAPALHGPRKAMLVGSARPDPARQQNEAQRLRLLFGLSPSEALLALALARGDSLREIADHRAVALGTVRFQVKMIAHKLGCSRQSDIVRTIVSLPALRSAS